MGHRSQKRWTVVETAFSSEKQAELSVASLGLHPYNPLFREQPRSGVRRVGPLFPGYLFVRIAETNWHPLRGARGVRRVMMSGDQPCRVRDEDVERLRSMEDAMGYVVVPMDEPPAFDLRQPVLAVRGPWQEQTGIYLGGTSHQRCTVLFAMMGKEVPVEMQRRDLAPAI